jgi:formylglycine-generating enzyme required for sulfatase activity
MGSNPSGFNGVRQDYPEPGTNTDFGTDLNRPVETVSWNDATNYCSRLTQQERAAGQIAANSVYRLPTEAEWEYACRAWTSTRFSYGDDPGYTNLTNYAWYWNNSVGTSHPVGQKLPNPWGLYDMHGNVWEWCEDWIDTYPGGIAVDPQGPSWGSAPRARRLLGPLVRHPQGLPVGGPRHHQPGLRGQRHRLPGCPRPRSAMRWKGAAELPGAGGAAGDQVEHRPGARVAP